MKLESKIGIIMFYFLSSNYICLLLSLLTVLATGVPADSAVSDPGSVLCSSPSSLP